MFDPYLGPALNRSNALEYCRSRGDDLVSIHSAEQMHVLNAMCKTKGGGCWTGLEANDAREWSWSDGSSLDYGFDSDDSPTGSWPWSGLPNNNGGNEHFVVLLNSGYGWNDYPGYHNQWVICDNPDPAVTVEPTVDPTSQPTLHPVSREPTAAPSSAAPTFAPSDSTTTISTVESTAVFVAGTELMTFDESDTYCKSLGMELASIHNDADNAAVHTACTDGDLYIYTWCWIGGTCRNRQQFNFSWTDGSDWSYTNWNSGEPNNFNNDDEDCVHMRDDGGWNDRPCDTTLIPICGYSMDTINSSMSLSMEPTLQPTMNHISVPPSTKIPTTPTPSESTTTMEPTLNSIAFAPYMTGLRMNQSDAVQYCQSRGHDLVSIHNDFQMNVTNKLCSTRGGGCWIGLRNNDTTGDGQWIWSDGTALDYGFNDDGTPTTGQWPWDDGEPTNYYNIEDGVVLRSNGWYDYPGHWNVQWVICNNLSATTSQTMNTSVIHWGDLNITGNASFTIDNGTIDNGDLASSVDAHFSIIGWTYSQIYEVNQDIVAFATSLTSYIHRAFADDELIEFNDVVLNISSINNLSFYDLIALDDSERMDILMTNMSLQYHIECDDIFTCFYISDDWH